MGLINQVRLIYRLGNTKPAREALLRNILLLNLIELKFIFQQQLLLHYKCSANNTNCLKKGKISTVLIMLPL